MLQPAGAPVDIGPKVDEAAEPSAGVSSPVQTSAAKRAEEHAMLQEALHRSEEEELQREGQDIQEALLRSKADAWSADGVTLARLTFHNPDVTALLLGSSALAGCIGRVESAGCEVRPAWANGALLFVPVTEEQIAEADLQLKSHNILMLTSDVQPVEQVLGDLPRRKRPVLKPEQQPEGRPLATPMESSDGRNVNMETKPSTSHCNGDHQIGAWMHAVGLVVERTFLNFPLEKDVSDASTIVQSAPAAGVSSSARTNPHRWHLSSQKD